MKKKMLFLLVGMFCFAFLCTYLCAEDSVKGTDKPSWIKNWKEQTVSLGVIDTEKFLLPSGKTEEKKYFRVIGSGILMALSNSSYGKPILVTAKHVFCEPGKNWKPSSIQIRFSWFQNRSVFEYFGIPVQLRSNDDKPLYITHPDDTVDLAAIPLVIEQKLTEREKVPCSYAGVFAKYEDLYETETVFILGFPGAVGLEYRTKPIVRKGIISWLSNNPKSSIPILADVMVFPGNSGGPAFIDSSGLDPYGNISLSGHLLFLGVVSTAEVQRSMLDVIEKKIADANKLVIPLSWDFMGLAGVIPAERVKELLEYVAEIIAK